MATQHTNNAKSQPDQATSGEPQHFSSTVHTQIVPSSREVLWAQTTGSMVSVLFCLAIIKFVLGTY